MEKAVAVICECNPFHNGHAALFAAVRARFPGKPLLCLMSANFVQRGEFAVMEKVSRAGVLAACGADLVLELPFPASCLSAERFAANAVTILEKTGLVSHLAFGSEIADAAQLSETARNLASPEFAAALAEARAADPAKGFPALREEVYTRLFGASPALTFPNASLATEYLMALRRLGSAIEPAPFPRDESCASASEVRRLLRDGKWDEAERLVPAASFEALREAKEKGKLVTDMEGAFPLLRYALYRTPRETLSRLYGVDAIADRAIAAAASARSYADFLARAASSRHTDSRVRRAALAVLTGIPRLWDERGPSYTRVLAIGKEGRAMLRGAKGSEIPVFTKPAHALRSPDPAVREDAAFAARAEDLLAGALAPALRPLPLTPVVREENS